MVSRFKPARFFDHSKNLLHKMATLSCAINITDNPPRIYKPGDVVRGVVAIHFPKRTHLNAMYIVLTAATDVAFYDFYFPLLAAHFTSKEIYFQYVQPLLKLQKKSDVAEFPAGFFKYKFSFVLPPNSPSSVEDKEYKLVYTLKTVIDVHKDLNKFAYEKIYVRAPTVLRSLPDTNTGHFFRKSKLLTSFGLIPAGRLTAELIIPKQGYKQNEKIPIYVAVRNNSSHNIDVIEISLMKAITYHSTKPNWTYRTAHSVLTYINLPGVNKKGFREQQTTLKVPEEVVLPNFKICRLLKVSYELWIDFDTKNNTEMRMVVPIYLGSH